MFLHHKSTPLANGNVNPSLQSLHMSGGSSSLFIRHSFNHSGMFVFFSGLPLGKSRFINLSLYSNILSMLASSKGHPP